jgi:hypothetical protein
MSTDIIQTKAGYMYIICHLFRPGGITFATELEHRHYPPDEVINDLFTIFNITYHGGTHFVIEIPSSKIAYEQADAVAKECNLNLVPGKPFNGLTEFPVNCLPDHCFVLETLNHDATTEIEPVLVEAERLREKYSNPNPNPNPK